MVPMGARLHARKRQRDSSEIHAGGIRPLRGKETCGVAEHRARLWSSTFGRARSGGFARRVLQGEVCCEPMEADQAIGRGRQPTARWLERRPIAAMGLDMRASIACGRTCSSRLSPERTRVGTGGGVANRGLAAQCRPRRRCGCKGIGCFRLSTATETGCRRHATVVLGSRHAAAARLSRFVATAACGVDNVPRSHSASPECQISNSYHLDLSYLSPTCSAPLRSSRWHTPLSSSRSGAHERRKPPCGLQAATGRWIAAHVGGCHTHPRGAARRSSPETLKTRHRAKNQPLTPGNRTKHQIAGFAESGTRHRH